MTLQHLSFVWTKQNTHLNNEVTAAFNLNQHITFTLITNVRHTKHNLEKIDKNKSSKNVKTTSNFIIIYLYIYKKSAHFLELSMYGLSSWRRYNGG